MLQAQQTKKHTAAPTPTASEAEAAIITLLRWIGEDPSREGLKDTPQRILKSWNEIFSGYDLCPAEALGRTFESISGYDDIIIIRDIPFYSHCEHHMAPIIGQAHVGYFPKGKIVGLSKITRVVDIFAHRLQIQEKMTAEIAKVIQDRLNPRGAAVVIEAKHLCMAMRGVKKHDSITITSSFTGIFHESSEDRMRFLKMINDSKSKL